uniref:Uncharacterized protein n=1 Tax=Pyricularia oryzae (strain 70-15 / ATCC MYA-4617 / FGSC 8958) TaxID=242507 RepID=Q2KG72_PYRO7|nr:hypothetical protein MGCH7_ch7g463 [Pyricularia oryzae 70-15]
MAADQIISESTLRLVLGRGRVGWRRRGVVVSVGSEGNRGRLQQHDGVGIRVAVAHAGRGGSVVAVAVVVGVGIRVPGDGRGRDAPQGLVLLPQLFVSLVALFLVTADADDDQQDGHKHADHDQHDGPDWQGLAGRRPRGAAAAATAGTATALGEGRAALEVSADDGGVDGYHARLKFGFGLFREFLGVCKYRL